MNKKLTKLVVFDFDKTLVKSPESDAGKRLYQQKTGNVWPHKGWWGHLTSLDPTLFDIPFIQETVDAFRVHRQDTESLVVMLTGRQPKFHETVKGILDGNDMPFDLYLYNTGGSTDMSKVRSLSQILSQYADIQEVVMFEDRENHIIIFENWGKENCMNGRLKSFEITWVPPQ